MYTSIIILIGIIILLMGYIKFHIDLQFFPDERKWYEKIRFILPLLLLPIFSLIYVYWDQYPNRLIEKDSKIEAIKTQSNNTIVWPYEIPTTHSVAPTADEDSKTRLQEIGEKYGTYGDTYGSLNTLFTGFAFAGLIISIFIQLLELRQTRKELSGQKSEFAAQTKILERQTIINSNQQKIINDQFKEIKKNNFIDHYYKIIDQRNILLENLSLPLDNQIITGHSVIVEYYQEFRRIRKDFNPEIHDKKYFSDCWETFTKEKYGGYNYQLRSYFKIYRVLFHTIESTNNLNDSEKKYYAEIFRMFLSLEEQLVLMWQSTYGSNLTKYCNKYGLLTGIYNSELEKIGVTFFKISAFGTDNKNWKKAFNSADEPE